MIYITVTIFPRIPESILPNFFLLRKTDILPFFAIKLVHFIVNAVFSRVKNTQAKQKNRENEDIKIVEKNNEK